jgi:hypothetical protein
MVNLASRSMITLIYKRKTLHQAEGELLPPPVRCPRERIVLFAIDHYWLGGSSLDVVVKVT